ncbi:MAG TPA: YggS family pyridoxal phosphate-dependent enzyme [Phycisphaerae bacterium]|nr:YggS family pyridoxal phosphate-dependent enzyme [Phycisphaerae bacterium]
MAVPRKKIEGNLTRIREQISAACARSGRSEEVVSIVAVTKSVDVDTIRTLVETGLVDMGESLVNQLIARAGQLDDHYQRRGGTCPIRWHMVGHLQRNKVKSVLPVAAVIHSVDSLRLAEEISVRAEQAGRVVDVMIQVNCSEEPQKSGVAVGAANHLVELISTLRNVRVIGLMTMAARVRTPEDARPVFVRLREIFEELRFEKIGGGNFRHLSMGMSQDYAVAVEEGATMLRIGTALFE